MAAIGSLKGKKLGFGDDIEDDYGNSGMYFNASVFPPHRQEKEVKYYQDIWVKVSNFFSLITKLYSICTNVEYCGFKGYLV